MAWQSLENLPALVQHGDPQDLEYQFPDGEIREPRNWKELVKQIVRHLSNNGHLKPYHCPVTRPNRRSFKYVLDKEPCADGEKLVTNRGTYFLNCKYNDNKLVENAITIVKCVAPELLNQFKYRA